MVILKTKEELAIMKRAGSIAAEALAAGGAAVKPGVTTAEINRIIHDCIVRHGAKPSFLGYGGFPASACISVNDEVIHGIPSSRIIQEGDIVSIDVGAVYGGYHGDNAQTFSAGIIADEAKKLIEITQESLELAIAIAKPGARLGDIGYAIQSHCEQHGYGVVREFVGHGVGKSLHEDPQVPNYGKPGRGVRLMPGMTFAIEPMINLQGEAIYQLKDGWTIKTRSGSVSAHVEHTIAITDDGAVVLTRR